jgi:deazaflavin-dependent oxidoreductase (nitroreductase family)
VNAVEFNRRIIEEFRANGGRVGGSLARTPILLLHHTGARSGAERVTPLAYRPDGQDRYVVVASNGGSPTHPGWYHNLKANPLVEIEVGTETFAVRATELERARHRRMWSSLLAASPSLRQYDATAARRIPMLTLTRLRRLGPCGQDATELHPGPDGRVAASAGRSSLSSRPTPGRVRLARHRR